MFDTIRHPIIGGLILALAITTGACSARERRNQVPEPPDTPASVNDHLPGDYVEEMVVDGETRQYRLHIPPSYQPHTPVPLVVNLHGLNSNAAEQEKVSGMSIKADEAGFIVVHPEALGSPQTWHIGPRAQGAADLKFIHELILSLENRLSIDPSRIYATGISNGAQMSNRLACDLSEVIAAIAPVSGGYSAADDCRPLRPVPVVAFHGTADKILPYEGKGRILLPVREWAAAWAVRNGCDPTPAVTYQQGDVVGETWGNCRDGADVVLYTIRDKGHSWPGSDMPPEITTQDVNATDVIWEFFAAHPMLRCDSASFMP